MARYAITIFVSAFLLFQVQPLIGKFILPWFGGAPAVWTTCMLFFQVMLLAGYAYAHLISTRLPGRAQTILHLLLLAISLAFLPILPNIAWKSAGEQEPIGRILALLGATIGLPYFLLATTGPLLQEGFRRETGNTPYRLYALSNVGSLLALVSYPFVFEPQLTLRVQIFGWSAGYVLFVLLCGWCSIGFARTERPLTAAAGLATDELEPAAVDAKPTWGDVLFWLALAACGSSMLLATTNQLCQEVSSIPFLWVLPLAIYLITFIITFDHERWYHPSVFLVLLTAAVLGAIYTLQEGNGLPMEWQLASYSFVLFVCCMVCHGELVRSKPAARFATWFYLMVAAGGAAGGILVGVLAPLVLHDFLEYHIALVATVILAALGSFRGTIRSARNPRLVWIGGGLVTAAMLVAGWMLVETETNPETGQRNLETTRNFYGVLHVNEEDSHYHNDNGPKNELIHGQIQHGFQYLDPVKRRLPTTYYGPASGIGIAIQHHPRRAVDDPAARALRIGVVGLGCGTIAAYGEPGDYIRFYEINPEVLRISDEYFTYRRDSRAKVDVVLGDARIRMEQELAAGEPQRFDVLAVDAFSSDAIPMHLLTKECVELYRKHLKPDGLLCLHVSNRFLDLNSVARGVAAAVGCECVLIDSDSDYDEGYDFASWCILTTNKAFLESPEVKEAITPWDEDDPPPIVWTDDYGSLWQAIDRS